MTNPLALIIEDDKKLSNIFSLALKAAQFDAEIVADGETALARLADTVPAIVMLDLHLPHISGEKILQTIRADARLINTQVVLATADALMAEYLHKDVDLVLLKPISVNQLREVAKKLRGAAS